VFRRRYVHVWNEGWFWPTFLIGLIASFVLVKAAHPLIDPAGYAREQAAAQARTAQKAADEAAREAASRAAWKAYADDEAKKEAESTARNRAIAECMGGGGTLPPEIYKELYRQCEREVGS
jgi:hypothetical protein